MFLMRTIHQPGFEPEFERWQRPVMTATLLMFEAGRSLLVDHYMMPFAFVITY